jgi:hypothetical protein
VIAGRFRSPGLRSTGLILGLVSAVAAGSVAFADSALPSGQQITRLTRDVRSADTRSGVVANSFVSFVPACACGNDTELGVFSLRTGRRLGTVGRVSRDAGWQLGTPAATDAGRLFYTATSGAVCAYKGTYMECPGWIPDSCVNQVEQIVIGAGSVTALTLAGSEALQSAVPDPQGSVMALAVKPCENMHGTTGLFLRATGTGRTEPVFTTNNPCDGFGTPAWNAAGTALVFAFDRASGPAMEMAGGYGCPGGPSRLAVARLRRSQTPEIRLIKPDRGCAFTAAAFDRSGIAAAEGCKRGSPRGFSATNLGRAYLLQLAPNGRLIRRLSLKLGLEQAVVAPIPHTGAVLVTQDQPANEPYPERDWVWEFDGTQLRAVGHYRANDAAEILAVPW